MEVQEEMRIFRGTIAERLFVEWTMQRSTERLIPFVFHRNGRPIKDFRGAWDRAFEVAGVERKLFHDFRRTAITNYVNAGVDKRTCRAISGHLTESVFERYNIRDDDADQQAAALAIARHLQGKRNGAVMGQDQGLS